MQEELKEKWGGVLNKQETYSLGLWQCEESTLQVGTGKNCQSKNWVITCSKWPPILQAALNFDAWEIKVEFNPVIDLKVGEKV